MPEADDVFETPPQWRAAINTIKDLIDAGEAMLLAKELPEGPLSKLPMERYAREYCKTQPAADLAIIYAILGVVTATAAQGAYVIKAPIKDGGWLYVPAIQMVLGVAPSGWGKSTALDVGMRPLEEALRVGLAERRAMLPPLKDQAIQRFNDDPQNQIDNLTADIQQFKEVYDAGICAKTLTEDPTQEALRNQSIANGGHGACVAAEPDIFRSMTAYNGGAPGSMTLFLNGWDQRKIDVTRVSNSNLTIDDASLAMCVLFQTAVFTEITSGLSHGMGAGADSFVARGMFARFWTVETDKTADFDQLAEFYSDDNDFDNDPNDPHGYRTPDGRTTPLGSAYLDFAAGLKALQLDSNPYRVRKAFYRAWTLAAEKHGTDLQVPEPSQAEREIIFLVDEDARLAYRRTQRMMSEIMKYIETLGDDEIKDLWNPLATRITQHVLREALVATLVAGRPTDPSDPLRIMPWKITGQAIEDAACRILPWRWCHSANALTRRAEERAEDILADTTLNTNPQSKDVTSTSMIRDLLYQVAIEDRSFADPGLPWSKLKDKIQSKIPRASRNSVLALLKKDLALLTADPTSGIEAKEGPKNITGKAALYYTVRAPVNF